MVCDALRETFRQNLLIILTHQYKTIFLQGDFDIIGGTSALTEAEVIKVIFLLYPCRFYNSFNLILSFLLSSAYYKQLPMIVLCYTVDVITIAYKRKNCIFHQHGQ